MSLIRWCYYCCSSTGCTSLSPWKTQNFNYFLIQQPWFCLVDMDKLEQDRDYVKAVLERQLQQLGPNHVGVATSYNKTWWSVL